MRIIKIKVNNYRLLQNFEVDLEESLSLIIGKNNTGKTSLLTVLDKFINASDIKNFSYDDFNNEFKKDLCTLIENDIPNEDNYLEKGITLKIFVEYNEEDNLENLSKVMMDLNPENNYIVLGYEYVLDYTSLGFLKEHYDRFLVKEKEKEEDPDYTAKDVSYFLKAFQSDYFSIKRKSIEYDVVKHKEIEESYINLDKEGISLRDIISYKTISAKRDVANKEVDKTLSRQTSKIYRKTEVTDEQSEAIEEFKDQLIATDEVLSEIYSELFETVIEKVRRFGGIKESDSTISIESTLQHRELLEGNTTVMYNHEDTQLPEYNNGLGYMNLISIIFEIEILRQEFKRKAEEKPADVNLLFIEEPEAHTHPQMQYVFIKNIKNLIDEGVVREDGNNRKLHTIVSTHSSHIVAECDFDDVKYLRRENEHSVEAKNLSSLRMEYEADTNQYDFLRQYLTISRSEIFFADKAILIEGDTERILLPTLMKKFDKDEERRFQKSGEVDNFLPLLSQNISIVEVGAYSQIFEKFISFLGIKSLIITDLDTTNNEGRACRVTDGVGYSNSALSHFFSDTPLDSLMGFNIGNKIRANVEGTWVNDSEGKLCLVYQIEENGYCARSFEDAFINSNFEFVKDQRATFQGLKKKDDFIDDTKDQYYLANNCIKKKTHFALDILYHTNEDFTNWSIPEYINQGLQWLKKD